MSNKESAIVSIWTDGSTICNSTKRGGWAAILVSGENVRLISGYKKKTTVNEMETRALLEALKLLKYPCMVSVYTDSRYVVLGVNAVSKNRLFDTHTSMWKEIKELYDFHLAIKIDHISAHRFDTDKANKICDRYAYLAAKGNNDGVDKRMKVYDLEKERDTRS